jgi:hypothetical protein
LRWPWPWRKEAMRETLRAAELHRAGDRVVAGVPLFR